MEEEIRNAAPEQAGGAEDRQGAEALEELRQKLKEERERRAEALAAMKEGKGRLKLETPIHTASGEIDELSYDFTALTGLEYIYAMDAVDAPTRVFDISYRQAIALFAAAAAKESRDLDAREIQERIGITDAVTAEGIARLFFTASARAGQKRISKR